MGFVAFYDVNLHPEVDAWYLALPDGDARRVNHAIDLLTQQGPGLGRPLVDQIKNSRHANMKELRVGTVRMLFAFDPNREAFFAVAGDKRGQWNRWYDDAVKLADDRFDEWLDRG